MSSSETTDKTVQFLCCTKTVERIKNYGQAGLFGDKNVRPFHIDAQGFLICPEHGRRRFGWLSARETDFPVAPIDPDKPPRTVSRIDHGETPIERDRSIRLELGL